WLKINRRGIDEGRRTLHEHGVDRVDQRGHGTPVGVQGIELLSGIPPGGCIREDVAAAETVDGLLGVADHDHSRGCTVVRCTVVRLVTGSTWPGQIEAT